MFLKALVTGDFALCVLRKWMKDSFSQTKRFLYYSKTKFLSRSETALANNVFCNAEIGRYLIDCKNSKTDNCSYV